MKPQGAQRPVFDNGVVQLWQGDSRHLPLEDGTVSCVVTSPPYLGLRAYAGSQKLVWDEPAEPCEHQGGEGQIPSGFRSNDSHPGPLQGIATQHRNERSGGTFCLRCLAWHGAFGLEPTPDLYIRHLMTFMGEMWRVMRPDAVCWVNIGDSYAGSGGAHTNGVNPGLSQSNKRSGREQRARGLLGGGTATVNQSLGGNNVLGIRAKSLMLIPERFALE